MKRTIKISVKGSDDNGNYIEKIELVAKCETKDGVKRHFDGDFEYIKDALVDALATYYHHSQICLK